MSLKECCDTCGFPINIIRNPIIIKNDIVSLIKIKDGTCNDCEHQSSGFTIPSVNKNIQILLKNFVSKYLIRSKIKELDELINLPKTKNPILENERKIIIREKDTLNELLGEK